MASPITSNYPIKMPALAINIPKGDDVKQEGPQKPPTHLQTPFLRRSRYLTNAYHRAVNLSPGLPCATEKSHPSKQNQPINQTTIANLTPSRHLPFSTLSYKSVIFIPNLIKSTRLNLKLIRPDVHMVRRHLPHPIPNHTSRMRAHGPNLLLLLCRCCWMRRHPKLRRMMGRHKLARRSPRRMRPRRRWVVRWRREHCIAGVKVVGGRTRRSHRWVFGCHGVPVHGGHGRRRVGGHGHGAVAGEGGVGHELRLVSGGG